MKATTQGRSVFMDLPIISVVSDIPTRSASEDFESVNELVAPRWRFLKLRYFIITTRYADQEPIFIVFQTNGPYVRTGIGDIMNRRANLKNIEFCSLKRDFNTI